ncbi:MAG: hypothetical protein ACKOE0_00195, partial [Actinomycetes bacterium]
MSKSRIAKRLLGSLGLGAILAASLPVTAFAAITIDGIGSVSIDVAENSIDVDTVPALATITGGDDQALFQIDGVTNRLEFLTPQDFENPVDFGADGTYSVEITDGGISELVFVRVVNVNESPVISSNGGGAAAAINVAEGATAVTTVVAADPDSGAAAITYSITGGADAAFFSIVGATGVLTMTARDFEAPADAGLNNTYVVQVTAGNGLDATQTITVSITNVNDNSPDITSDGGAAAAAVNVVENTVAVTTVAATDADNDVPTFS